MLWWEDLLTLRRNRALPGHAEMEGKTLFFKCEHRPAAATASPPAAGQAFALEARRAARVSAYSPFEGEGGHTPGAGTRRRTPRTGSDLPIFTT